MSAAAYTVRCLSRWSDALPDWAALARDGRATPFQTAPFLKAWYETLGARPGVTPAIIEAVRAADGAPALLLPLVVERRHGLRVIAFADAGVADNNAPVLGPGAPDAAGFPALWQAVRRVLPAADMLRFEKMPETVGGRPNPLLALGKTRPSQLSAHPLEMPDTFEAYSRSRTTKFRKEQERIWRVFTRHDGARFGLIDDPEAAAPVIADMDRLQAGRMKELGVDTLLEDDAYLTLYRRMAADGLSAGDVALGALTANGETVGALLGISDGRTVTFVRIGHAGGEWANASPGRLVIERMMMALHERGVRRFDFSIGDYGYKEPFRIGMETLLDLSLPLSWRAWPSIAAGRAKAALRRSPLARRLRDGLRGKPAQSLARST